MTRFIVTAGIIASVVLSACKKDDWVRPTPEINDLSNKGFLKVYNATVGSPAATNIYVNNTLVTGAFVGFTGLFPASVAYAAIDPGTASVVIKDTAATPKINLTASLTGEAGKYYTLFTYDTLASAKYKIIQDTIVKPADTSARIRFANFVFSSVTIPNVDIYSQNLKVNILTNITKEEITTFINHPSQKTDTFYVRATGTTTNLSGVSFNPGVKRSYTLIFRGRYQTTTGTSARTITSMTNY